MPATDGNDATAAWVFRVDPRLVDLVAAFADGDAVLDFEVDDDVVDALRPGQVAHLWLDDEPDDDTTVVPSGIYATGSVVSRAVPADGAWSVEVGLDPLAVPVDGLSLLSGDEFVGSELHLADSDVQPVGLDRPQADAVAANPLAAGPLASVLLGLTLLADEHDDDELFGDRGSGDADGVVLPALEVRLPADTLLVVPSRADGGEAGWWTVVRASPDMAEVAELPERHATLLDAVEYVAGVARHYDGPAGAELPVVDLDDGVEAIAIFDPSVLDGDEDAGVYVVVKTGPRTHAFCFVDDDGSVEILDEFRSLKEAILLPVLDGELFGA